MKTIVIDPGHGGKDRKNIGYSGKYIEADGNLEFSLCLKEELQDFFNVILTREKDVTLSLTERANIAIKNKADMFISIHSDAWAENSSGVTIFDSVDLNNEDIAYKIGKACANAMGIPFRGCKERESEKCPNEDYYTVIDKAQDGGVSVVLLLERGFHSNPHEEELLLNSDIVRKSAIAVANEIKEYYGIKSSYTLIKLESGRIIKAIETENDYLIPLSDIEDILMPISIINYDKINYDNKIKEGDFVVLKKGMKGEKVKELQEKLIELGYKNLLGRYGADGVFGQATYTAVIKFQQDNGLKVDGIVGKNTWRKINELLLENKHENIRKEYLQVIVSILNVRNDKWGKIIGQVKKGDILEKIGVHKDGDWYKIKFKDLEGYVSSKYVVPYQNIKGFKKIRKYDSDIYIYETSKDEFVDVTLGQYGKLETLSNIVKNSVKEVMCAVNGGFFDTKGSTEHLGTFVDEGLYYKPPSDNFIDFIYYKDGTTEIKKIKDLKEVAQLQVKTHWVIGTSWSLVKEGKIDLTNANKILHSRFRNPRTLLGQKKDGTFVLVVVDGRRKGSKGMTAKQCGELMLELGCYNAVNLDGGGSSEMIVNNTIVNHPSDGHERRIGSAILVYKI